MKEFINSHTINIMNNGSPTRVAYNSVSAIDLLLCSSAIEEDFTGLYVPHHVIVTIVPSSSTIKNTQMLRTGKWRIIERSEKQHGTCIRVAQHEMIFHYS